jgi:CDP-diacylglycerol--serine O-phosphatidyltransferase
MIDDHSKPAWAGNFFTGVPAPAGAITVLLPIYINFLGVSSGLVMAWLTFLYTLVIALLMVSRLPVFSGKQVGKRVAPEMVLPVFVLVVLFFALLVSYPWEVLTIGSVAYLGSLPFGWLSYRNYQQNVEAVIPVPDAAVASPFESPLLKGADGMERDRDHNRSAPLN